MNYYRHIDRNKVQFDFLVHRQERAAFDDEIESLGGRIYRLPRLVLWSKNYLAALNRFFDEHSEHKIVHVHQDCLSSVILKVAAQHNVPVRIAHSHNANQDRNLKYPIKLWYRRSIPQYATNLFACGKDAGDWMFSGASYQIINNAIDVAAYSYDSEKRIEMRQKLGLENELTVGHVGRFNPQKNHPFLLDIFAALLKKEPDAVLLLVGGGEDMTKIQAKAQILGIAEHVRFLGVRSDVADLMQTMDVFVFPSLYEGLPVTLFLLLTSMPTNNGFTIFTSPYGDFRPAGFEMPMITGASATSRIRIIPEPANAISLTAERAACVLANSQ